MATKIKVTQTIIRAGVDRVVARVFQVAPFGVASGIVNSIFTAAGSLITSTAAETPSELLAAAASGDVLTADLTQPKMMKWATPTGISDSSLINRSGADRAAGDVVVQDATEDSSFTTTTTEGTPVIGVCQEVIEGDTPTAGQVKQFGITTVNVQGNVAKGDKLCASSTEARAKTTTSGNYFGIALTAYSGGGAGQVTALIFPDLNIPPVTAVIWHDQAVVTAGNALEHTVSASQRYCTYSRQTPSANGDTTENGFYCAAGEYTLNILCITTDCGKVEVYVDDVLQGSSIDMYSAGTTYNVIKTLSITVLGSGYHVIKTVINGKNASSSGYALLITKMWLEPSAY